MNKMNTIMIWVEPQDKEVIRKKAKENRETMSSFVRKAVLEKAGIL